MFVCFTTHCIRNKYYCPLRVCCVMFHLLMQVMAPLQPLPPPLPHPPLQHQVCDCVHLLPTHQKSFTNLCIAWQHWILHLILNWIDMTLDQITTRLTNIPIVWTPFVFYKRLHWSREPPQKDNLLKQRTNNKIFRTAATFTHWLRSTGFSPPVI